MRNLQGGNCLLAMGIVIGLIFLFTPNARADLQNVEVGGSLTIYGDFLHNASTPGDGLRWNSAWLVGRPVGAGVGNADGLFSWAGWDNNGPDNAKYTMWTRLHVRADFTDNIVAFIEFDSVDTWGEDFRSNYVTGQDMLAWSGDDVEVYQAYIEAKELFGTPIALRIGRQEMSFGSEWLVGNNNNGPSPLFGLSFDAIRATYATDILSLDVFTSKLAERFADFGDQDIDFSGIYASYTGIEEQTLEAYWFWLRDAQDLEDSAGNAVVEWVQNLAGVDQYGNTNLHTLGLRGAGAFGAFDYEAEAAYQFGEADQVGALYRPVFYGDDSARYDTWGANLEAGYTIDVTWQPRLYLGYAYLGGEDNGDISFGEWLESLVNPFYTAPASVCFNRLFSNLAYNYVLEASDLSNAQIFRGGVGVVPTEQVELSLELMYLRSVAAFARPVVPFFTFWTEENDKDLGWATMLNASYAYSDDLSLSVGWTHLFTGDGLEQGNFNSSNGTAFDGGTDDAGADYAYFQLDLSF